VHYKVIIELIRSKTQASAEHLHQSRQALLFVFFSSSLEITTNNLHFRSCILLITKSCRQS